MARCNIVRSGTTGRRGVNMQMMQTLVPSPETSLSVNLNKVALIRNARGGNRPNVSAMGEICLGAGAAGLTLHPRPDGRHARARDVLDLRTLTTRFGRQLNIEGNPFEGPGRFGEYHFPGFMELVRAVVPDQVTLVPDAPGQLTSDHGWDVSAQMGRLIPIVHELRDLGCRVSLFVDPRSDVIRDAADLGTDRVELYTGPYAVEAAHGRGDTAAATYSDAAEAAAKAGLGLNAGHDLDLDNLGHFLRAVPGIAEVSIGQALVADALEMGFGEAVRAYLAVIEDARKR